MESMTTIMLVQVDIWFKALAVQMNFSHLVLQDVRVTRFVGDTGAFNKCSTLEADFADADRHKTGHSRLTAEAGGV